MKRWYNNHHDRFPGEYYCYILVEYTNGFMVVYDQRWSNVQLDMNKENV